MANKQTQSLTKFWEGKVGRNIISFGRWLLGIGVLKLLLCAVFILVLINYSSLSFFAILYLMGSLGIACFFIYCGQKIKSKDVSPDKISNGATSIIMLIVAEIVIAITVQIMTGETTPTFGIMNVLECILLFDGIRYKLKWHGEYTKVYNSSTGSTKPKSNANTVINQKKERSAVTITVGGAVAFLVFAAGLTYIGNTVFYSEEIVGESLDSSIIYEETDEIELGQQRVKTYGNSGSKETIYRVGRKLFAGEVSREETGSRIVTRATDTVVEKGTKRYRFMWCSDNYYLYFNKDTYDANKTIGYTWSGEDACQKEGHGTRVNVSDSPPPTRYYYYYY